MFIVPRPRQHDDFRCATRHNHKPTLRCDDVGHRPQHPAQSADFNPQPSAIGIIDAFPAERPRYENLPRHICRPCFREEPRECEQDWTPGELDRGARLANAKPTSIDDECSRSEYRFDVVEPEVSFPAVRYQARSRCFQDEGCRLDLCGQSRDSRLVGRAGGAVECELRRRCLASAYSDPCDDQFVGGPESRRNRVRVEPAERLLGAVERGRISSRRRISR